MRLDVSQCLGQEKVFNQEIFNLKERYKIKVYDGCKEQVYKKTYMQCQPYTHKEDNILHCII